ncbi:MAG: zinc ribbon domain-containing protein [Candidatus Thermoplasmatota archaeon]
MALTEGEKIILLAVLAVLMVFVLYFEFRIMRGKAKGARRLAVRKDEAYNAILTCRSVMNVLERQGSDVSEARSLVNKAKSHMERGEHETAIDLCERARDELTKARKSPAGEAAPRASKEDRYGLEALAEEIVTSDGPGPAKDTYSGSKLEVQGGPSYLVAKFELNTAREEISKASRSGKDTGEASELLRRAQAEFDAGNYTKSLSMSVKAKKAASPEGAGEAIPLRSRQPHERPSDAVDGEAEDVVDVCSSCGSDIDAEDAFCGSCGAKRRRERACPSCGRAASESDKFCRKCGAKVP